MSRINLLLLLAFASTAACSRDLRLDFEKFACTSDQDCIRGTICDPVEMICVRRGSTDAGAAHPDADEPDAELADAGFADAATPDALPPIEINWGTSTSARANWWLYTDLDEDQIDAKVLEHNARIVDLELQSTAPDWRYTVVLIENTGVHYRDWIWVKHAPRDQWPVLMGYRTIDLEIAGVGLETHLAAVLWVNSGAQQSGWWWWWGTTDESLVDTRMTSRDAMLLDFERYEDAGGAKLAMVMVPRRDVVSSWHAAQSPVQIQSLVAGDVELTEIEHEALTGRFTVVTSTCPCERGAFVYDVDEAALRDRCQRDGMRIERIEHYLKNAQPTFAAILVDNEG